MENAFRVDGTWPNETPVFSLERESRSLATRVFQFAPNGSVARKIRDCHDLLRVVRLPPPIVLALESILISIFEQTEPSAGYIAHEVSRRRTTLCRYTIQKYYIQKY